MYPHITSKSYPHSRSPNTKLPVFTSVHPSAPFLSAQLLAPIGNDEIAAAKTHWEAKHDQSLIDKINSEVSGGLKDLIVGLLMGKREETEEIDEASYVNTHRGVTFDVLFTCSLTSTEKCLW